jgi:hypothetical protein
MTKATAKAFLREHFRVRGYLKRKKTSRTSHGSYELRFSTSAPGERAKVLEAMKALGFKPGRTFAKHSQSILPYYGAEVVTAFQKQVGVRKKPAPKKRFGRKR